MHCTGGAIVTGPLPVIRLGVSTVRRFLTWGLVVAVAALGLAAGLDALRGGGEPEPAAADRAPSAASEPAERTGDVLADARADLEAAGVPAGRITYADEDCRNHVVTLPDLRSESPTGGYVGLCRYWAVVGGLVETIVSPRSPDWNVRVRCKSGWLSLLSEVVNSDPRLFARARGCGAAWKPDGAVTFVQDGEIRRFARCPDDGPLAPLRCSRPVLTRAELARQLRGAPWSGYALSIKELHWLNDRRFAAIMQARSAGGTSDYLVIFERERLVREPIFAYADLGGIRPSPSGRLVAAYDEGLGGIVVVDSAGESVQLAMDHGDGITWSPDERWIAEATEDGIYVFRADEDSPEFIQIPVVARDLLWE
jgi:hypothetical protein